MEYGILPCQLQIARLSALLIAVSDPPNCGQELALIQIGANRCARAERWLLIETLGKCVACPFIFSIFLFLVCVEATLG